MHIGCFMWPQDAPRLEVDPDRKLCAMSLLSTVMDTEKLKCPNNAIKRYLHCIELMKKLKIVIRSHHLSGCGLSVQCDPIILKSYFYLFLLYYLLIRHGFPSQLDGDFTPLQVWSTYIIYSCTIQTVAEFTYFLRNVGFVTVNQHSQEFETTLLLAATLVNSIDFRY